MKPPRQPSTCRPTPRSSARADSSLDRVDRAVAVVAGRAHDGDGLVVDQAAIGVDVDLRRRRVDRRLRTLDAEQVAGLVEGRVAGLGLHEVRAGSIPRRLAGVVAVGEHGVEDAPGAAGGDDARRLAVGDRLGVEQVEGHGDDLALEPGRARADVALQGVHVGEQPERLVHEGVVLVVAAVHGPGDLAGLPGVVLEVGHRAELGEHLRAAALLGQAAVDRERSAYGNSAIPDRHELAAESRHCHARAARGWRRRRRSRHAPALPPRSVTRHRPPGRSG